MISALLYLYFHSSKNRLVARLRRLKQPKYLAGAIVGGLYLYFYFLRYLFSERRAGQFSLGAVAPETLALYESLGALALLVIVLVAWLVPKERAALAFTEAEVAFLFPAPITRRGLIHYKLFRSQFAILISTLFLALISNRFGAGSRFGMHALGWWVILSTLNLHFLGASFARTMLLHRGISNWKRRGIVLLVVAALLAVMIAWGRRSMSELRVEHFADPEKLRRLAESLLASGPMPWLLLPFRLVVRPFLAPDALKFCAALAPALALIALHYWWVIRSDVAFEEASADYSRKLAEKIAAARAGQWQGVQKPKKRKRAPFKLQPTGPPAVALLWKNLLAAGQLFSARAWLVLLWLAIFFTIFLTTLTRHSGILFGLGFLALPLLFMSLLIGPQVVRQDFRQDLLLMDVLKLYPMRGWQIALGELLAPAAILTGVQWLLLVFAVGMFQLERETVPLATRIVFGLSAAMVFPALNLISLQIPNAAALLFPAWFQAGKEGPHGIEATGQRIIFALGQFLVFVVALVPVAVAFALVFFAGKFLAGWLIALPLAAVAATLVLAVEAGVGVALLGRCFERFDLSAELNP